ncbi:maleylpyruvate isomerase mycothiol-dependent enzyme family protein [Streptomyces sp. BYX5S]
MSADPNAPLPAAAPGPVTADDVARAVELTVEALRPALDADWNVPAGPLEWTCWETGEHLADDLFFYAAQIGSLRPLADDYVRWGYARRRPDGPDNTITVEVDAGPAAMLGALEAGGGILAAVVRTTPSTARGFHVFGASDPEGFAAMGVVETLVHAHDLALGLGVEFRPPADLCARSLHRLFPDVPRGAEPWKTLLWATGRGELEGEERRGKWRWYGAPGAP